MTTTEHSDEAGIRAATQYESAVRRHMDVIAALRAIDEPESHRVVRRLARIIDRLVRATSAELMPYRTLSADELRRLR